MATAQKVSASELIAANVRELRQKRGWSQMELARRLGRQQARISEIENAAFPIGVDVLDSLAETFGVDPDQLLRLPKKRAPKKS